MVLAMGKRFLLSKKTNIGPSVGQAVTETYCPRLLLSVSSRNLTQTLNLTWHALMPGKNDATAHIIILITAVYSYSPRIGQEY